MDALTTGVPGRLVDIRADLGVALAELEDGRRVVVGGAMPLWDEPCTSVRVLDIAPWEGPSIYRMTDDGLGGSAEPDQTASADLLGKILTYESDQGPGWILLNCGHYVRFDRQPAEGVRMTIGGSVIVTGLSPYTGSSAAVWAGKKYIAREIREGPALLDTRWALPSPLSEPDWQRLREEQRAAGFRIREVDIASLARRKWPDLARLRKNTLTLPGTNLVAADSPHVDPLFDPWRKAILAAWVPALRLDFGGAADERMSRAGGDAAHLSRTWPACPLCRKPLSLIAEIFLADIGESGSLAVFFCLDCGAETERVHYEREGAPIVRRPSPSARDAVAITRTPIRSRLRSSDLPSNSVVDDLFGARRFEIRDGVLSSRTGAEIYDDALGAEPTRSQIGGFAPWIQDDESECPSCGKPRLHIVTLARDTGFEMGDDGALFVLACNRKPTCGWLDRVDVVFQCH